MGWLSKAWKKVEKQVKRSAKQVEKQVSRSSKQVEKQIDRSYDDVRELNYKAIPYLELVGQILGPFVPGVSTAVSLHSGVWGKDEDGYMMINPIYNTGGTALGQGSVGNPTPGIPAYGAPDKSGVFYWPGTKNPINPIFIWGGIGLGVLFLLKRKK